VHLANPYKVRTISKAKIKTDTVDVYTLAKKLVVKSPNPSAVKVSALGNPVSGSHPRRR
jgi:hypothetical protein